jgi:hypothetical protein
VIKNLVRIAFLNLKIDGSCVFEVKKPAKDNFDARKC